MAPLKDGSVQPDGIQLMVITNMEAEVRHRRMLRHREFDVADGIDVELPRCQASKSPICRYSCFPASPVSPWQGVLTAGASISPAQESYFHAA